MLNMWHEGVFKDLVMLANMSNSSLVNTYGATSFNHFPGFFGILMSQRCFLIPTLEIASNFYSILKPGNGLQNVLQEILFTMHNIQCVLNKKVLITKQLNKYYIHIPIQIVTKLICKSITIAGVISCNVYLFLH